jgi:hypothetical protein
MKSISRAFVAMVVLVVLIGPQSPGVFAQSPQPFDTTTVSKTIATVPHSASARPGLDSTLSQLLDIYEANGLDAAQVFGDQCGLVTAGNRVQVVVMGGSDAVMSTVREAITTAGGALQSAYANFQQAMVPISVLESLADRSDVKLVRQPWRPVLLEPDVGAQTSEGVAASLANVWHTHSVPRRGEGVKVAIVDAGFSGYAALLGTDLPATVTTQDYTASFPGTSPHGTACAEIVYDMAYGVSRMYLVKIATDVDLANAITYLIGQGVHVMSMSLGWMVGGPGDGTDGGGSSPLYDALDNARTNGIFVAMAAGNNRDDMWSGTYSDHPSAPGTHQWPHGGNVNCIGPGTPDGTCYLIDPDTTISASLHWDSWPSGPEDYDLYLLRDNGSSWAIVASSTNRQTAGAEPVEFISYLTTSAASPYGFAVVDYSTSGPGCFRLILSHSLGASLDEQVESRTLIFPSDSPDAMAVAAVDVTSYAQESYSSEGPTFGSGGACTGGLVEPDIAAYANVSTVSYGAGGFNGTSAATPHVAGAAVLYTGAYSATVGSGSPPTPAQTQAYLETNATDLLTSGRDNETGEGRLTLGGLGANIVRLAGVEVRSGTAFLALFGVCAVIGTATTAHFIRKRRSKAVSRD